MPSSLVMVPVPGVEAPAVAPARLDSATVKVSSASGVVSPWMATVNVLAKSSPASHCSVPVAAV
ncbi:hypothetical protein D3C71_1260820 [compost metagenome]